MFLSQSLFFPQSNLKKMSNFHSQNPFFSQDPILSQIHSVEVDTARHQNVLSNSAPIDLTSWVNNVIKKPCCTKECLKKFDTIKLHQLKTRFTSISKVHQELVLLSLLQLYRTQRTENQKEFPEYKLFPFGPFCATTFRTIFDISKDRQSSILKHLRIFKNI